MDTCRTCEYFVNEPIFYVGGSWPSYCTQDTEYKPTGIADVLPCHSNLDKASVADLERQLAEAAVENERLKGERDMAIRELGATGRKQGYAEQRAETTERELAVMRRAWELHDNNGAIMAHSFLPLSLYYIYHARAEQEQAAAAVHEYYGGKP